MWEKQFHPVWTFPYVTDPLLFFAQPIYQPLPQNYAQHPCSYIYHFYRKYFDRFPNFRIHCCNFRWGQKDWSKWRTLVERFFIWVETDVIHTHKSHADPMWISRIERLFVSVRHCLVTSTLAWHHGIASLSISNVFNLRVPKCLDNITKQLPNNI